jgi:DNA polymerase-3 subunit delta'
LWQIIGQSKVVALLRRSLETGTVAHAYLLVGPPHVGKMTLAINLAQTLNCESAEPPCGECASCQKIADAKHPDVIVVGLNSSIDPAEAKTRVEISIDQIREMQHSANLPPFEGEYKVYIINEAELLSIEAANCLLKTLEEPASRIIFILLARSDKLIPKTVVSRCQRLELLPLATNEVENALKSHWGIEAHKAVLLARLCRGCLGWAVTAASDNSVLQFRAERIQKLIDIISADYEERFAYASQMETQFRQRREAVMEILDLWLDYWHDLLLVKAENNSAVSNIDQLSDLIAMAEGFSLTQIRTAITRIQVAVTQLKQNANPRLTLEVLMLDLPVLEGNTNQKVGVKS